MGILLSLMLKRREERESRSYESEDETGCNASCETIIALLQEQDWGNG